MMDRCKATVTAPQPGEGTQPTRKHSIEGSTSHDDISRPLVPRRGKRDSTEKGQGCIIRMFPPPHCCYLSMPSLRHFTSLPPPCPVIDDLTAPTAIIGVTTNELWLKRDDMFYNMNHESLLLRTDTRALYRLMNLQGRTTKPENCLFLPQYACHLQRLDLAFTMSNDYASQLAQKLDQVRVEMNSWRAERRGWEAAILARNGMQPSILQGLLQAEEEKETRAYFPEDFAGYHPEHTEEHPIFLHSFHHKNEKGSLWTQLRAKLAGTEALSLKIDSAIRAERERIKLSLKMVEDDVVQFKREEQGPFLQTTPEPPAIQAHVAEDEDFFGAFDPPLPPITERDWNLDEENSILHRESFLKWVMGRYMMWKPKEVKITTVENCRTIFNLPSMPIPSPWPSSIRELRLPSSPSLRDHTPWQFPASVLLAFLKERSKVNDSVTINTLFTKEALRALREMETAWQNLDVSIRLELERNNDTVMDWVPDKAVTLLKALVPCDISPSDFVGGSKPDA
ncbi:hypothetical protein BO83DRAFT_448875 [Aspergillus eucalypticola CBS 122712]|uniref:Uncharacterized protein n=1 Tax=Aspergillus eucalypticola (strain CBS 122712 / IBT 29274) TaxID=1448314 RepID=A0A317V6B8_ASPEC|nr:uncharacterized protein BO83DRAFT_448875 [Aspergillus eucalypticola CBS 122712]PWY68791.1 hypothetical protein BO83DRAFT_448875 [Aspergillus eucalypticola CBS 122712]